MKDKHEKTLTNRQITLFENYSKYRICLVTLFDRKLQVFKNYPEFTIFGIFVHISISAMTAAYRETF